MIRIKRAYEKPAKSDGYRVLVDRLWPRGVSKEEAAIDEWVRELSPSNELRRWYGHAPAKWKEFQTRYARELEGKEALLDELRRRARRGAVTLVFSSKEERLNNAAALKTLLERG